MKNKILLSFGIVVLIAGLIYLLPDYKSNPTKLLTDLCLKTLEHHFDQDLTKEIGGYKCTMHQKFHGSETGLDIKGNNLEYDFVDGTSFEITADGQFHLFADPNKHFSLGSN